MSKGAKKGDEKFLSCRKQFLRRCDSEKRLLKGWDKGLKTGRRKTDLPIGIIRVVIFLNNDVSRVSLSEIIIARR